MPRRPDMPCSMCGTLMWRGRTSAHQPICRPCRATKPKAPRAFQGECTTDGCDRPILGRALCATHYSYWHRQQKRYTITCAECGKTVQVARAGSTLCSRKCVSHRAVRVSGRTLRQWHERPRVRAALKRQQSAAQGTTGHRAWMQGPCGACGEQFSPRHTGARYCDNCSQHRRKMARSRRRARKVNAFVAHVSPQRVFEADGYRCHICKKKTNPKKQVPHPKAPTVDHLIPLALGGTHEPANCRTACFMCNAVKSDRLAGDQLLLLSV